MCRSVGICVCIDIFLEREAKILWEYGKQCGHNNYYKIRENVLHINNKRRIISTRDYDYSYEIIPHKLSYDQDNKL